MLDNVKQVIHIPPESGLNSLKVDSAFRVHFLPYSGFWLQLRTRAKKGLKLQRGKKMQTGQIKLKLTNGEYQALLNSVWIAKAGTSGRLLKNINTLADKLNVAEVVSNPDNEINLLDEVIGFNGVRWSVVKYDDSIVTLMACDPFAGCPVGFQIGMPRSFYLECVK